ncbi:MAG TPA: hypothetical protein VLB80_00585 [Candidatus Babeliales bacterium]|nr:hypothetical protein [Candidatus Babeliales bacterium]
MAWYLMGAVGGASGSLMNTIINKKMEPYEPWIKEKPLCPEMIKPYHLSYYYKIPSRRIQLRARKRL